MLHREAFLYEEPRFLPMQELREPRNYFAILRALAFGDTRLNDIVQHVGLDRAVVGRYLDILRSLGIVTREVPVTEASFEKSRKGTYRLADHFLRFWFRFVHPNTSDLEARFADIVARERVAPTYADFVAPVVEQVAMQWIRRVGGGPLWPGRPSKMGRWWDSQSEIDIAGLNEDGEPFFAECKWSSKPVGTDVLEKLIAKSQRIEWASRARPVYAIFYRCGFTEALRRHRDRDVRLIDLHGLLAATGEDLEAAKRDVGRFISDTGRLDAWTKDAFRAATARLRPP